MLHSSKCALRRRSRSAGISLIEMLVIISIIGILALFGTEQLFDVNQGANGAKAMRNAQNLSSMYVSAQLGGVDFFDDSVPEIIANIVAGDTCTDTGHPFHGAFFGMPEMSLDEQTMAAIYLTRDEDNRALVYDYNALPIPP